MKTYQQKGNKSLLIINHKTSQKVLINNVIFLKGNINYTTLYLKNGQEKVVARTIKFFEEILQEHGFLRVHRAFMINPIHVKAYNCEREELTMINNKIALISRRKKHTLNHL